MGVVVMKNNFMIELNCKEKCLRDAMGTLLFDDIKAFFQYIDSAYYHIKIFVSKKSYVLYSEFKDFLQKKEPMNQKYICCTDTAIPLIEKIFCDTFSHIDKNEIKIAVIDDILIHGRTLNKIYSELKNKNYNVDLYAFCKNITKEEKKDGGNQLLATLDNIKSRTTAYVMCDEFDWKYISKLIMQGFWSINTPFLSYSPFLRLNSTGCNILKKNLKKFVYETFQNHRQEFFGQKMTYTYMGNCIKVKDLEGFCFGVFQTNNKFECANFLPFTFFDNSSLKKIVSRNKISINIGGIDYPFLLDEKEINYKFISSLFSTLYLSAIVKQCNLKNDKHFIIDWENVISSFGKKHCDYLKLVFFKSLLVDDNFLGKENSLYFNEKPIENSGIQKKLYKELGLILNSDVVKNYSSKQQEKYELYLKNCNYLKNTIARYLKFNGNEDEKNLPVSSNRIEGMRVYDLITSINQYTKISIFDIITSLMQHYFIGTATIAVETKYGMNSLYYHAGEQSFKCIIKEFVPLVYFYDVYFSRYCDDLARYLFDDMINMAKTHYSKKGVKFSEADFYQYSNLNKDNVYKENDIEQYCADPTIGPLCLYGRNIVNLIEKYLFNERYRKINVEDVKMMVEKYKKDKKLF